MNEKETIILWKDDRGLYSQDAPGRTVASTISETALRNLAQKHRVFVLELSEDGESITVERLL